MTSRGVVCFFFNDTATTEIYTLSLHDALPICGHQARDPDRRRRPGGQPGDRARPAPALRRARSEEHTSELQSRNISYAVFCLKKKNLTLLSSFDSSLQPLPFLAAPSAALLALL